MTSLFVTGTDTNIGKTLVSSILARQMKFHYWKPVQTGKEDGIDSEAVAKIIGQEKIYPESYCLSRPLSPNHAAQIENVSISMKKILLDWKSCPKPVIIEGAGGLLVPLNEHQKIDDLIVALGVPVVLVARSSLGTINHTLLSVEHLKGRNISIASIILSGGKNKMNAETLRHETGLPVLSLDLLKSTKDLHSPSNFIDTKAFQL